MTTRWTMPDWMEPFRNMISDTGGNPIEELMNDRHTTTFENAPRAILCVAVNAQVTLLERLHKSGRIK